MTICDSAVEQIAKAIVRKQLFVSTKLLNSVNKALGYDMGKILVTHDAVHIAEKIASDNLIRAGREVLLKAISDQEKILGKYELRRIERISRGRTRGAGAGGFNRDIANIECYIDDAKTKIAILRSELLQRAEKRNKSQSFGNVSDNGAPMKSSTSLANMYALAYASSGGRKGEG